MVLQGGVVVVGKAANAIDHTTPIATCADAEVDLAQQADLVEVRPGRRNVDCPLAVWLLRREFPGLETRQADSEPEP
jgi:hypothetical protein